MAVRVGARRAAAYPQAITNLHPRSDPALGDSNHFEHTFGDTAIDLLSAKWEESEKLIGMLGVVP